MRFRILLYIMLCVAINFSISAEQNNDAQNDGSDLNAVFNVMYSLKTWGMAHDDELMSEMVEFAKNNQNNKYCFIIFDYLKRNTSWKNYRLIEPLAKLDAIGFEGWNKRYFEDLKVKYLYYLNDNDAINKICNSRYYVPEYYIVGPLKKDWNQLLRTEWSYLFDPETTFNTPFGAKKYSITKNFAYLNDLTNKPISDDINDEDYFSCTYLCAFTAYFEKETDIILKMNVNAKELYVNSVPLSAYFTNSETYSNQIYPLKFTKGRFDFVLQTETNPFNIDFEFMPAERESQLQVDFNIYFENNYGYVNRLKVETTSDYKYNNLRNYIFIDSLADEENKTLKRFVYATEIRQDDEKYNNWSELHSLCKETESPIMSYLFAKATADLEILSANIKQEFIPLLFTELIENHPEFILPRIELFNYYFNQNKYSEALEILEQSLSIDQKNKKIWSEFIYFYDSRGWISQGYKAVVRAADYFPEDTRFQLNMIYTLLTHNNYDGALELYEKIIPIIPTVPETYPIWNKYIETKSERLESFELKNEIWQQFTNRFSFIHVKVFEDYSEFLVDNNQYELALKILLKLFETNKTAEIARKISELYFVQKNEALGIEYLKKSISMNHKLNSAEKDYFLSLSNDSDIDMYKEYTIPIEPLLDIEVKPSDYPDSTSIVLLDEEVRRIFPDGSSSSIVTSVRRILTTEGAEEYGTIHTYGDVVLAQVIKPNGEIIEPSVLGTEINFQGIEIGSTQIIVTRELAEEFNIMFYFSDPEHKEYFLTSRMVILKSKSFIDFRIIEKFVPKPEKFETEEFEGFIYIIKNSKPIPEEKEYNPGNSEYLPHVNLTNSKINPRKTHFYFLEDKDQYPITHLINKKSKSICDAAETRFGKAKAIYDFVANNVKYDFFVDNPTETLLNLSGNKVNLLLSLYRSSGIKYEKIRILTSKAFQIFKLSDNISSGFYFADFIDALRIVDGEKCCYILLDNELMKYTAFAVMPYTGVLGFSYQNKVDFTDIDPSNSLQYLIESSDINVKINESNMFGDGIITLNYNESSTVRSLFQEFSGTQKKTFMNQLINMKNSKFTIKNYEIINYNSKSNLQIKVDGQYSSAFQAIDDKRVEISQCFMPLDLVHRYTPTASRKIKMKITDGNYENRIDTRTIPIPENYVVQNMPTSAFFVTRNFMYILDVERLPDRVILTRKWRTFPCEYESNEYETLKQYCQTIDEIEKNGITLLKKNEP